MTGYMLTYEGNSRFRKRKSLTGEDQTRDEGFEILEYLFDYGAASMDDLIRHTGLNRDQVNTQLAVFLSHGLVEGATV